MTRTRSQGVSDDIAFPVRLKIRIPPRGLGAELDAIQVWLRDNLPAGDFAVHSTPTIGGSAMAVHFRSLDAAGRFVENFANLQLADGTQSPAFTSPTRP